jgi:molecular chaperone GrpE
MTNQDSEPQAIDDAGPTGAPDPIATLEGERDKFMALAQRTQADFVNYKRRMEEERAMLARGASTQVITRLLPVLDDLQRAVGALPEDAPASWSDGVRMIHQNLQALLEAEGVSIFEPTAGETFDPAEHEAIYYQPTDEQPPGAVLSVVRPGYRGADRVLRPAQVVVAKEPDGAEAPQENAREY